MMKILILRYRDWCFYNLIIASMIQEPASSLEKLRRVCRCDSPPDLYGSLNTEAPFMGCMRNVSFAFSMPLIIQNQAEQIFECSL